MQLESLDLAQRNYEAHKFTKLLPISFTLCHEWGRSLKFLTIYALHSKLPFRKLEGTTITTYGFLKIEGILQKIKLG